MPQSSPAPWRGLAAGIAGGLAASFAMNQFQKAWAALIPMPKKDGDPATVKAAKKASRTVAGAELDEQEEKPAGNVVHYAFGALLGGAYGLIAEYRPGVTKGYGTLFGLGASTIDELAVPAAGLSGSPTETPPATHAYGLASHLVFGGVTEAGRRLLRAA